MQTLYLQSRKIFNKGEGWCCIFFLFVVIKSCKKKIVSVEKRQHCIADTSCIVYFIAYDFIDSTNTCVQQNK